MRTVFTALLGFIALHSSYILGQAKTPNTPSCIYISCFQRRFHRGNGMAEKKPQGVTMWWLRIQKKLEK